MNEIKNI